MSNTFETKGDVGASPSASWRWRMEDGSGTEVVAPDVELQDFPCQSDAESWVGEVWRDLVDSGVDAVTLFEGDRLVYGPMSLHSS